MRATWCIEATGEMLPPSDMPSTMRPATDVTRARVLAVDDDATFLALLRELVGATTHLEITGEADSGERAIVLARELAPDIVLMDIWMPGIGGMKAAERIRAEGRSPVIVMVSTTHPDEIPPQARAAVADAVLWKSTLEPASLDRVWLRHRDRV